MAQSVGNICPVGMLSLEGLFFSKEEMEWESTWIEWLHAGSIRNGGREKGCEKNLFSIKHKYCFLH